MNEDTVRIGTIVHFVYGDTHLPAIVTDPASRLYDPSTDGMIAGQALTVFPPSDAPFTTVAARDDAATPATWHWPEGASV